jgi:hypothetical protein
MYEVLTSPITLLCLGVVFLLISLLFFYFKRSLSLLERAQMEQARVLQSFITNMEMTRLRQYQPLEQPAPLYNDDHVGGQSDIVHTESNEQLIDVSDDDSDDSDDSGDSDEDSDDSDDIDDSDNDNDEETVNNENVSAVSINGLSILEIDELENSDDEIKVIQIQENNLEEISVELLKVVELPPMVEQKYNTNIDINDSISDSSVDSDTDSDDENVSEMHDILQNEPIVSIHKIPSVQELMTNNEVKEDIVSTDLKTLTLQKLRQIAVEKELIQTGSKPNKKELIKLIEDSTQ